MKPLLVVNLGELIGCSALVLIALGVGLWWAQDELRRWWRRRTR